MDAASEEEIVKPIRPVFLEKGLLRQPDPQGLHVGQAVVGLAYFTDMAVYSMLPPCCSRRPP